MESWLRSFSRFTKYYFSIGIYSLAWLIAPCWLLSPIVINDEDSDYSNNTDRNIDNDTNNICNNNNGNNENNNINSGETNVVL